MANRKSQSRKKRKKPERNVSSSRIPGSSDVTKYNLGLLFKVYFDLLISLICQMVNTLIISYV